jgi:hypothetical protein
MNVAYLAIFIYTVVYDSIAVKLELCNISLKAAPQTPVFAHPRLNVGMSRADYIRHVSIQDRRGGVMAGTEFKKGFATLRTSFRVPATVRYCTARLIVDGETWVLVHAFVSRTLIKKHESDRTKIECRNL